MLFRWAPQPRAVPVGTQSGGIGTPEQEHVTEGAGEASLHSACELHLESTGHRPAVPGVGAPGFRRGVVRSLSDLVVVFRPPRTYFGCL